METLSEFLQEAASGSIALFDGVDSGSLHVCGATVPMLAMSVASRFLKRPEPVLVVAKDYRSAEVWVENLESLVGEDFVRFFPSLGLKPYESKIPFEGVLEERLKFFRDIARKDIPLVVVCPLDALLAKLPKPGSVLDGILKIKVGDVIEPAKLRPWFLDHGFVEQPVVSGVGEFSIRGCIVDVNCLLYPHPIRIEFFGDEVESIRSFDIFSQRSVEEKKFVDLFPMGEFTIPERDAALMGEGVHDIWWCRDRYQPLTSSLLDYLPGAALVFEELSVLSETASKLYLAYEAAYENARGPESKVSPPSAFWFKMGELSANFALRPCLDMTNVETDASNWYKVNLKKQDFSSTGTDAVAREIENFYARGGRERGLRTYRSLSRTKRYITRLGIYRLPRQR